MHNSFLSVVLIADAESTPSSIARDVQGVFKQTSRQFSESEIIVVQNGISYSLADALAALPHEVRNLVQLVQLTRPVSENIASLAGLEHSRGQWTVLLTPIYANQPGLINQLYNQAIQQSADIVTFKPAPNNFLMRAMHLVNNGFGKALQWLSGINTIPSLTADGIFSSRAVSGLANYRNKAMDLPMVYAQLGMAGSMLPTQSWPDLNWRAAVEIFFTNWRRLLRGNILRYLVLLHSALVFAYAWLTTTTMPYIAPLSYGENPNAEVLKMLHTQNIVQAWIWFALSLGLIGLYQIWRRLRQLPDEAPYTVQRLMIMAQK